MAEVGFIGLGVMGGPIAMHLQAAGHRVTAFNRTRERAAAWLEAVGGAGSGARLADTPAEAAREAAFLFTCVGADADLREVMLGEAGALAALRPGSVFVDHSTVSATIARELAAAGEERGIGVLDAPVSGGQAGAEQGRLTVMVGGDPDAFARAEPVIAAYARHIGLMGPAGSGQLTKMVNQVAIAGVLSGLAEALRLAETAGLDPEAVVEVIGKGAAQSWQMDNRWRTMARGEFDFGFAIEWMRKDLGLVLDQARALGLSLPATALVDQFYAEVAAMGGGRQDTSALVRRIRRGKPGGASGPAEPESPG